MDEQRAREEDLAAYDRLPPRVRRALAMAPDNLDACTVERILPVVEMIETGR